MQTTLKQYKQHNSKAKFTAAQVGFTGINKYAKYSGPVRKSKVKFPKRRCRYTS